jgi:hypothetical protein
MVVFLTELSDYISSFWDISIISIKDFSFFPSHSLSPYVEV